MFIIYLREEGKEIKEITPFEDVFNRLHIAEPEDYFDLGFEACVLFLEKPETSSKVIINNLQGFDYYSNRVFVPFVINEDVYNDKPENIDLLQLIDNKHIGINKEMCMCWC